MVGDPCWPWNPYSSVQVHLSILLLSTFLSTQVSHPYVAIARQLHLLICIWWWGWCPCFSIFGPCPPLHHVPLPFSIWFQECIHHLYPLWSPGRWSCLLPLSPLHLLLSYLCLVCCSHYLSYWPMLSIIIIITQYINNNNNNNNNNTTTTTIIIITIIVIII